jgi:hypothetical protein
MQFDVANLIYRRCGSWSRGPRPRLRTVGDPVNLSQQPFNQDLRLQKMPSARAVPWVTSRRKSPMQPSTTSNDHEAGHVAMANKASRMTDKEIALSLSVISFDLNEMFLVA